MKKILFFILLTGVANAIFCQNEAISNDNNKYTAIIDTSGVLIKTDSLAAVQLKKYDEESSRHTGVPIAIEHYDRSISLMPGQDKIVVTYDFNKSKFYGPAGSEFIIHDADKYPFHFDITMDQKSNNVYMESD